MGVKFFMINFPNSPSVNDEYSAFGRTWKWTGNTWDAVIAPIGIDSQVRALTGNWDSTYTTVQSNSSTNWNNYLANQYTHTNFLPLTGGILTGGLTTTSTISSSQTISANGARVITGLSTDSTPVYYITVLTQGEYDAIGSPDTNTLYFIKP